MVPELWGYGSETEPKMFLRLWGLVSTEECQLYGGKKNYIKKTPHVRCVHMMIVLSMVETGGKCQTLLKMPAVFVSSPERGDENESTAIICRRYSAVGRMDKNTTMTQIDTSTAFLLTFVLQGCKLNSDSTCQLSTYANVLTFVNKVVGCI